MPAVRWCFDGTMQIDVIDPASVPDDVAEALADLSNAAARVDAPHLHPVSGGHLQRRLRYGHADRPSTHLFGAVDGSGGQSHLIGFAELDFPEWDNLDLAGIDIAVHPHYRGAGVDDELLARGMAMIRGAGRSLLLGGGWLGSDAEKLWLRHGFTVASREAQRRLVVADLDWPTLDALYDRSLAASADYDVAVLPTPAPADVVPGLLDLHRAMNDAPMDDLAIEDESWDTERLRRYERAMTERGIRLHRLLARRRSDGELGGHTIVAVEEDRPRLGFQEDTAVVRGHRGHRLGMRLKLEMLRRLRTLEPQIESLDTWNMESNSHMIAVNDALGCVVVGRAQTFQKKLTA